MPFKSKAQQRFMFSQHPEMAKEFADATPNIKALPQHVKHMAEGGLVQMSDNPVLAALKAIVSHKSDTSKADAIDPVVSSSSDTPKGYAEGGTVDAAHSTDPEVIEPGVYGQTDPGNMKTIIDALGSGMAVGKMGDVLESIPKLGEAGEVTIGRAAPEMEGAGLEGKLPTIDELKAQVLRSPKVGEEMMATHSTRPAVKIKYESPGAMVGMDDPQLRILNEVPNPNRPWSHPVNSSLSKSTLESYGYKLPEHLAYGGETNAKHETLSAMQNNPSAGFAAGGEVPPPSGYMQGATDQMMIPADFQNMQQLGMVPPPPSGMPPLPPLGQHQPVDAQGSVPPPSAPLPPSLSQAAQSIQNTPPTDYNALQGISAEDRASLMQKLLAQKASGGNLAASGVAGLGDAISNSFGKGGSNAAKDVEDIQNKNVEQRAGVVDTERTQKMQDIQMKQEMQMNDANSPIAQSMRQTLQSAGLKVPSGMSPNLMLKVAGPLGELALKQATLAETHEYHQGSLGEANANRQEKEQQYASEHPILNFLNPVGGNNPTSPISNPHGIPDLGSTFNGEKVVGVKRIR